MGAGLRSGTWRLSSGDSSFTSPLRSSTARGSSFAISTAAVTDAVSWLLTAVTLSTLPLVGLALLSNVAEPHWVAPLYLALPIHLARRFEELDRVVSPRLRNVAAAVGAGVVAIAHVGVLVPIVPRLFGASYVPRYDLVNDLFAWESGLPVVKTALRESLEPGGPPAVVIGPHWTVCAQLHAGLPASVFVGCQGETPDDFSRWLPSQVWEKAPVILYVTDDRFGDSNPSLTSRRLDATWNVNVQRGGVRVRRISVARLILSSTASFAPATPPSKPSSR